MPNQRQLSETPREVTVMTRVMNVDEVARYLRVVPDTIYRKARRGEIPAVKMGKVWRFPKETLDKWLNDAALETVKKD
jgi:PTS system nitrogen regulatory IIA component